MSETTPGTDTRSTFRIAHDRQQEPQPHSTEHNTAGTSTRSPRPYRNHHRGSNPSRRPPVSQDQREKYAAAQKAYVATDPRWAAHRQKLADIQIARRMTLFDNEVAAIVALRRKGRTFDYIAEEIGVCCEVISRELRARGIDTSPVRADRRARRGRGFWRCFD